MSIEHPSARVAQDTAWQVPVGSALALAVGIGPIGLFTYGILMAALSVQFGWSRASLGTALALCAFASAIAQPIVGIMMDKYGARRLLVGSICLYAVNVAALGLTESVLAFTLLMGLSGVTGAATSPIGYIKCVAGHFDRRRGLAIGVAMLGIGAGSIVMPQLAQWLIGAFGVRTAYLGLALAVVLVALPAVAFMVADPPATPRGPDLSQVAPGLTLREALAHRSFWCICVSALLVSTAINGALVHSVPLLVDRGWDAATAAKAFAAAGAAGLVSRLVAGFLMDRVFAPLVATGFLILAMVGIYLLARGNAEVIGLATLGLALGAEVDLVGYLVPRYFGVKRFGQIFGVLFAIVSLGSGLGPLLLGVAHTRFHNYELALIGCGTSLAVSCLLLLLVGPYVYAPPGVLREASVARRGGSAA
ncbi:Sugar phosphate permease [Variovorax sp. HW608]|uniref:MFS transporter n=1 Tax=Variovorax sp. HW608 TaxID=1034889 RepID=UPI00081F9954|nr:MFS transporter [Variovorax sp. HW608]SCK14991.1 Sugar phosphate permease [Variovorax sp. HW608]